ncbi:MAG: hypothetical protein V1887_02850 [Candidatus Aenigmatarchaeota archaeon]
MAGVIGIYSKDATYNEKLNEWFNAGVKGYFMLMQTQHRGQANWGMVSAGDRSMRKSVAPGLVSATFTREARDAFIHPDDYAMVGHIGDKNVKEDGIAPIHVNKKELRYEVATAIDGAISSNGMLEGNIRFQPNNTFYAAIFSNYMENYNNVEEACLKTADELGPGYYSMVGVVHDKVGQRSQLVAFRNRRGVKPMYMGRSESGIFVSSESGAIDVVSSFDKLIECRDVVPGEVLTMDMDGYRQRQIQEPKRSHCAFEWVYTSRHDAVMEGITSHMVRKKLGHLLVELYGIKDDGNSVVIGVPDSGRSVAIGIHEASGIPIDEGLIKNQYIGRTYDIDNKVERIEAALLKHNPINAVIKGKKVHVGEDSIVRGTISDATAHLLKEGDAHARVIKEGGAKYVTWWISYAPIFDPCFSDSKDKELAAKPFQNKADVRKVGESVAKELEYIDMVYFNTPENVIKAIGLPEDQLCTFCITGKNPFKQPVKVA